MKIEERSYSGIKVNCRTDTIDSDVALSVITEDEYHIRKLAKLEELFVDIGAYCGHASLLAASLGMKCTAIEPLPENLNVLHQNFDINEQFKHFPIIVDGAIGHNQIFWNDNDNGGFESRHRFVTSPFNANTVKVGVTQVDLDKLLIHYDTVHIIKTDCEGGEWSLPTFPETLAKTTWIVGEFHTIDDRTYDDFRNLFPTFDDVTADFQKVSNKPLRIFVFKRKAQ